MDDHDGKSVTLLYVDGEGRSREQFSASLVEYDAITVQTASTVTDAIDHLDSDGYLDSDGSTIDCIVSAFALPDGTGLELAQAVRNRDRYLPFVLYPRDEHGSERLASEASAVGVTSYLPRSLDDERELLLRRVADGVAQYERERERELELDMFDTLMNDVPLSIYFKDRDGRHVRASKEVGPTMSIDPIGKTDPELYGKEIGSHAQRSYEDDMQVIETGEPIFNKEEAWAIEVDDAETIWLRSTKIPWRDDDGTIRGLVGVTRDVTELKRREAELEQQKQRLDRFASFASHDLRTPLNIAKGYLDIADETDDSAAIEKVRKALKKMDQLIDDMLTTAQSDVGLESIESVPFQRLVEETWADTTTGDAKLRTSIPPEAVINADKRLLKQLLQNLFRNAVEHGSADRTAADSFEGTAEHGSGSTNPRPPAPEDTVEQSSTNQSIADAPEDAVEHDSRSQSLVDVLDEALGKSSREHSLANAHQEIPGRRTTNEQPVTPRGTETTDRSGGGEPGDDPLEIVVGTTETGFFVADNGPGIPPEERDSVFEYGYSGTDDGTGVGLAIVDQIADAHDWNVSVSEGGAGGARFDLENCLMVTDPTARTVPAAEFQRSPNRIELHDDHDRVDIGDATPAGDASYDTNDDVWAVTGGGRNLWHRIDECHFVHTRLEGDVRIIARVTDVETVNKYSKAGLMLRSEPEAGSPLGYVGLTPHPETELLWRPDPGDVITSRQLTEEPTVPHWYRLDWIDGTVRCYHSVYGDEWIPIDQRTIECEDSVSIGLAVCSHDPEYSCTALFEDVSIVPL